MRAPMTHEGGPPRVLHPAYVAHVQRRVHMCQYMLHLHAPLLEGLSADRTDVRLDPAVTDYVTLEVALVEEGLAAGGAHVRLGVRRLPRVLVPAHVCLQGRRGGDASLADPTLVAGLEVHQPGVRLQSAHALVDAPADGARHGDAAVVFVHVPLYANLRSVLLVADAAVVVGRVQVSRGEVLRHVRHIPGDGVAELARILGFAVIQHHVNLQLVGRDKALAAYPTRVPV